MPWSPGSLNPSRGLGGTRGDSRSPPLKYAMTPSTLGIARLGCRPYPALGAVRHEPPPTIGSPHRDHLRPVRLIDVPVPIKRRVDR